MNLEKFDNKYNNRKKLINQKTTELTTQITELNKLFENYGGYSFDNGVFRIHNFETSKKWTDLITESFPKYINRIVAFGFDWAGRQFARGIVDNKTFVFDISIGKVFELKQPINEFFNVDLIEYADDTLDFEAFKDWNRKQIELKFNEVVGYKIPLWLGGKDEPNNFEIADAEVDWELNRQLRSK